MYVSVCIDHTHMAAIFLLRHTQGGKLKCRSMCCVPSCKSQKSQESDKSLEFHHFLTNMLVNYIFDNPVSYSQTTANVSVPPLPS